MPTPVDAMTWEEAWSERAELARGPGANRRTERYKQLSARIGERTKWESCDLGAHDWREIPRWYGRYSCHRCGVIGYRSKTVITTDRGERTTKTESMFPQHGSAIVPYKCPNCKGPTTKYRKATGSFPCPACRE